MNPCNTCQVTLTIDQLAATAGTSTRSVRSFQTLGLLPHPRLRGRTGLYSDEHLARLRSILALQDSGFSLQSLSVLYAALDRGQSLATVLGIEAESGFDEAERYGFVEFQPVRGRGVARSGRPLLTLVPTTLWEQVEAS
jgi:DNA-binding transcriptional MerR regulator